MHDSLKIIPVPLMYYLRSFLVGLWLLVNTNALSQQRIFVTVSEGDLYSIDFTNCSKHFVGATGIGFGDIAFTSNGLLWGIYSGQLFNIDTSDASVTLIGSMGIGPVSLVGVNDTMLLAEYESNLYAINTNDASSHLIGEIGYYAHGDLVLLNGTIYMLTPFIKIELNETFSQILNVTEISLTMPVCEGAATHNDDNYIVGFSGIGAIEICQIDGSYKPICPNLTINSVPGAASIPNDFFTDGLANIFTPNGDGVNDFFQPFGELNHIKEVLILNRWGNEVISLKPPFIWDGSNSEGNKVPNGVYYCIIQTKSSCEMNKDQVGIIHVIY